MAPNCSTAFIATSTPNNSASCAYSNCAEQWIPSPFSTNAIASNNSNSISNKPSPSAAYPNMPCNTYKACFTSPPKSSSNPHLPYTPYTSSSNNGTKTPFSASCPICALSLANFPPNKAKSSPTKLPNTQAYRPISS